MKRFHNQKEIHFDKSELKTNLGNGNFIFVGSSNDLFADNIDDKWILDTLKHCEKFKNKYLFQTKNPERLYKEYSDILSFNLNAVICTTIESNRIYPDISKIAPITKERAKYIGLLEQAGFAIYITAEPIMDFDLDEMVELIRQCKPKQVNIGADSGNNHLIEPPKEKILQLISELEKFTIVNKKVNLYRLLKNSINLKK
jgi:DNA repair photolyase